MDTRITPFGDHPNGGKIREFEEGEQLPDHMMPLSKEAKKILETISPEQRMSFIVNSEDPRLEKERDWILNKFLDGREEFTKKLKEQA